MPSPHPKPSPEPACSAARHSLRLSCGCRSSAGSLTLRGTRVTPGCRCSRRQKRSSSSSPSAALSGCTASDVWAIRARRGGCVRVHPHATAHRAVSCASALAASAPWVWDPWVAAGCESARPFL
eukprot:4919816-Prymnesium_polylepis.2